MNRRVRTLLRGMSTASLIMASALPALGQYDPPPAECPTRSKTKQVESSKEKAAKDNAAAKKKGEKAQSEKTPKTKGKAAK